MGDKVYRVYLLLPMELKKLFPYLINYDATEEMGDKICTFYAYTNNKKYLKKFLEVRDAHILRYVNENMFGEKMRYDEFNPLYEIKKYELAGRNLYLPEIEYEVITHPELLDEILPEKPFKMKDKRLSLAHWKNTFKLMRTIKDIDEFNRWLKYYFPTIDLQKLLKYL